MAAAASGVSTAATTAGQTALSGQRRPNILFILTDDQRWDALGYAGNRTISTPELDRLCREGIYFKNSFVTTPISGASRATILTGMNERTSGYSFGVGNIPSELLEGSYPAILRHNGYYTGFFGKFGVNTTLPLSALFDRSESYDRKGKTGYFYKTIDGDTVHLTDYTGWQARRFIAGAPEDKPFCLSLSFSAPHTHDPNPDQYIWQASMDNLYKEIAMPDPVMGEEKWFLALPEAVRKGINRERWYWRFDTPQKYQHSIKGYYRMISGVDAEIGKIRRALEEKGVAGNTVIIFLGDNGYFEGERQLAGKWLMYENSLRVPMIIYDPRTGVHRDVDRMVLNLDIAQTILGFCGVAAPPTMQGEDLSPCATKEGGRITRESFLCEHLWNNPKIPASEGIRTREWKYFRYRDFAREELYNLRNDPWEMNDLAGDPKCKAILEKLRAELDAMIAGYSRQGARYRSGYTPTAKQKQKQKQTLQ
ncbi:acetylglucosamine-6-sulfatase [Bacteroidia bacterium]|nr:acetylglucosamine-6-sulfatase [Bacteroidia bacterium]